MPFNQLRRRYERSRPPEPLRLGEEPELDVLIELRHHQHVDDLLPILLELAAQVRQRRLRPAHRVSERAQRMVRDRLQRTRGLVAPRLQRFARAHDARVEHRLDVVRRGAVREVLQDVRRLLQRVRAPEVDHLQDRLDGALGDVQPGREARRVCGEARARVLAESDESAGRVRGAVG